MTNESQEHVTATSENPSCDLLNTVAAGDLPDMIPVRMLNEFTYCPRLGYLEWVEGEWAGNLETIEGAFGHRRVDQAPKRAKRANEQSSNDNPKQEPNEPSSTASENRRLKTENQSIHARSLLLSAPTEGLLAKLDLLELEGMEATPVDYKRGKAPNIPEGAYEPERTQLCAQGLIL